MRRFGALVLALGVLAACSELPTQYEYEAPRPLASILDGAHGTTGNAHFFFLPPMAPAAEYGGTFDPSVAPVVEICVWDGDACRGLIASFSTDPGGGSETIRIDEDDEHYHVNWKTKGVVEAFPLGAGDEYRIRVLLESVELGHADVVLAQKGKDLRGLDEDQFVGAKSGSTLPIKFRIEEGALPPLPDVLGTGYWHTCALDAGGAAWCWGGPDYANRYNGWLGTGDFNRVIRSTPQAVGGGWTFETLTAGFYHTCGVTADGDAYCWGWNAYGQLGVGPSGSYRYASPRLVTGGKTWRALSAGWLHTCGVTVSDEVYCWGYNGQGQLGLGSTGWIERSPRRIAGIYSFADVTVGYSHSCGLTTSGDPICWGQNHFGQLGRGTTSATGAIPAPVASGLTFTDLDAAWTVTCGLDAEGAAHCWGRNDWGQIGDGTTTDALSPTPVAGGHTFSQVSAGAVGACGIRSDGETLCWGHNVRGALGDGTAVTSPVPVTVSGGHRFGLVRGGVGHTCGLTRAGDLSCWGWNHRGQLGDGTTVNRTEPVLVFRR